MKIALLLLASGILWAQTTRYPGALDSDSSLFLTADNVQSPLSVTLQPADTAVVVQSGTGFAPNMIISICDSSTSTGKCTSLEHMLVTAVNGNVLTVTRAFAGTTAKPHTAGKLVNGLIAAAHHNATKNATVAIETALGPNLSNILGADTSFARQVMSAYWNPPPTQYTVLGTVNPPGPGPSISVGFTSWMRQNSANGNDAVAVLPSCEVNVAQGTCFGMNIVLGSNGNTSGATQPKLVGIEIDLQSYYTLRSDSYALSAVNYNLFNPSPAIIVQNGNHGIAPPAWGYAFYSEDGATSTALYVGANTFTNGSNSQNILFHTVDAAGTSRLNELVVDNAGKLALNFAGIFANSSAIKIASATSCTTAATVGATCNTTVNWPSAFIGSGYFPLCTITATAGTPYIVNEQGHTPGSTIIQIAALTATAANGTINCLGVHN